MRPPVLPVNHQHNNNLCGQPTHCPCITTSWPDCASSTTLPRVPTTLHSSHTSRTYRAITSAAQQRGVAQRTCASSRCCFRGFLPLLPLQAAPLRLAHPSSTSSSGSSSKMSSPPRQWVRHDRETHGGRCAGPAALQNCQTSGWQPAEAPSTPLAVMKCTLQVTSTSDRGRTVNRAEMAQ